MGRAAVWATLGIAIAATSANEASAGRVDRVSARTFLADATAYLRISVAHHLEQKSAVQTFIDHLESSCPGSLAHAPVPIIERAVGMPPPKAGLEGTPAQRTTSQTFLTMALGELKVFGYGPIRAPALTFANELTHLHWTKPSITRTLADSGRSIMATLALSPPDFCADARASAAIGFASAPPEATQFAAAFRAAARLNGRNLGELAGKVQPYLAKSDLGTLERFRQLWSRAEPLLQIRDATVFRLLRAVFAAHR